MLKLDKTLLVIAGVSLPWSMRISLISLMIYYFGYGINPSGINSKIVTYFVSSAAAIAWYIFFGKEYFKPNPLSNVEAVMRFSMFAILLPLPMLSMNRFMLFSKSMFFSMYIFCVSTILWTLYVYPSLLTVSRQVEIITTGDYANSPGIMNVLAVCVLGLLYLNVGLMLRLILFGVGIYVVALGQSRTGMILLVLGVGYELIKTIGELIRYIIMDSNRTGGNVKLDSRRVSLSTLVKFLIFTLAPVAIVVNIDDILNSEPYSLVSQRFEKDGLESNRSKHLENGIEKIMSGSGFLGDGKGPEVVENTYWYHNLFLDSFRVGGIVGLILSLIFAMAILGMLMETLKRSYIEGAIIAACMFLFMSTVALEGLLLEFIAPYFLIALMFLVHIQKPRQIV